MDNDRDRRDAAGVGPYPRERDRLVSRASLGGWRVSKGEPDIRGWEVRTVSGRQLGVVRDLLIDREAGEAVMLDVDLPGSAQNTLVPIRVAQIDRAARVVLIDSADLGTVDRDSPAPAVADIRRETVSPSEVVVDRRPIVEETVVRRREPDDQLAPEGPLDGHTPRQGDRRAGERRRIDRMGTDL